MKLNMVDTAALSIIMDHYYLLVLDNIMAATAANNTDLAHVCMGP